ncbi:hypothetical protein L1887_07567 [Cichorium endivia]|nr:hypothetical protein L1887_07567 [Cichorium endivia]
MLSISSDDEDIVDKKNTDGGGGKDDDKGNLLNDELWYMNPSDSDVETNHLTIGRAHGAYHEVLVTTSGKLVGAGSILCFGSLLSPLELSISLPMIPI